MRGLGVGGTLYNGLYRVESSQQGYLFQASGLGQGRDLVS